MNAQTQTATAAIKNSDAVSLLVTELTQLIIMMLGGTYGVRALYTQLWQNYVPALKRLGATAKAREYESLFNAIRYGTSTQYLRVAEILVGRASPDTVIAGRLIGRPCLQPTGQTGMRSFYQMLDCGSPFGVITAKLVGESSINKSHNLYRDDYGIMYTAPRQ